MDLLKIVVFAVLAAVLILRLRSVLGRRTGHERPPSDGYMTRVGSSDAAKPRQGRGADNVVSIPHRGGEDTTDGAAADASADASADRDTSASPAASGLAAKFADIKRADSDFDVEDFIAGATSAFEIIINSFTNGDKETLRPLLADDVYDNFARAIAERKSDDLTLESKLVSVRKAEVIDAELDKRTAYLTVKFVSEQINVTHDSDHRIVAGDPNQISTVTDIWTFARDTKSRNPNWTLVATDGSN